MRTFGIILLLVWCASAADKCYTGGKVDGSGVFTPTDCTSSADCFTSTCTADGSTTETRGCDPSGYVCEGMKQSCTGQHSCNTCSGNNCNGKAGDEQITVGSSSGVDGTKCMLGAITDASGKTEGAFLQGTCKTKDIKCYTATCKVAGTTTINKGCVEDGWNAEYFTDCEFVECATDKCNADENDKNTVDKMLETNSVVDSSSEAEPSSRKAAGAVWAAPWLIACLAAAAFR